MKLDHLLSFKKIAETKSFTRAAQELFVTQPTITNHIQALEYELGCPLLIRSSQSTRLTAEGEELAQKVEQLFAQLDDIKDIGKRKELVYGDLLLAASSAMGTYFLPPVLKTLTDQYPEINIRMHFGNSYRIATWVQDGFIDIGFAPWAQGFSSLSFHRASTDPCVIVTSSDYYRRHKEKLLAGDFSGVRFILREKGTKIHDIATSWLKKYPQPLNNRSPIISHDMESIKQLIMCGIGASILPLCCVKDHLKTKLMHQIHPKMPIPSIKYYIIHRKNENFKPIISLFLEEMNNHYSICSRLHNENILSQKE